MASRRPGLARLIAIFISTILALALIGPPALAAESVPPTDAMNSAYTYDAPAYETPGKYTAADRGPPLAGLADTIYSAVDLGSHAGSARLDGTTPAVTCAYDHPAPHVQDATVGAATHQRGHLADRDIRASPGASVAANGASKFGSLTHASSGIAPYSTQRLITAGQRGAIQAHHLIEKRFAAVMGQNTADMSAIVVTRAEHQVFTNAWRQAIPYGSRNVTPTMVNNAAKNIYGDYPEILQALGLA